jgi:hypothetical protein
MIGAIFSLLPGSGIRCPGGLPPVTLPSLGVSSLDSPRIRACAYGAFAGGFSGGPLTPSDPSICASSLLVAEQEETTDDAQGVVILPQGLADIAQAEARHGFRC